MEDALVLVQMLDELGDAALVEELVRLLGPLVGDRDVDAFVQEGLFAQPLGQLVEAELGHVEDLVVRLERDLGAVLLGVAGLLRAATPECLDVFQLVDLAVAPDLEAQPFGQEVHAANADAVQAARNLVGVGVELAARVQHRHHDLGRRALFLRVHVGRNAAAVVDRP